jgi:glycosyltransferase involved in cell wall biosynthesis
MELHNENLKMKPEFSVIIPLLNKGPYIERAIFSVLHQTFQNFEIIVIDGGSEDNGPEMVKNLKDPRIHFLVQQGKGVSNARNEAIASAKSDFIAFLDADDEWMLDFLQTIVNLIKKYPYAGIFATKFTIKTKNQAVTTYQNKMLPNGQWEGIIPKYFLAAAISEPLTTSAIALPKHIFYEFGGFPQGISYGEDMLLWGKIALKYDIAYSNFIGAIYHLEAENRLSNLPPSRFDPYPFAGYAQKELLDNRIVEEKIDEVKEYIASKEINRAYYFYSAGDLKTARIIARSINTKFLIAKKIKLTILLNTPRPLFNIGKSIAHHIRNYFPNFCIELMD